MSIANDDAFGNIASSAFLESIVHHVLNCSRLTCQPLAALIGEANEDMSDSINLFVSLI